MSKKKWRNSFSGGKKKKYKVKHRVVPYTGQLEEKKSLLKARREGGPPGLFHTPNNMKKSWEGLCAVDYPSIMEEKHSRSFYADKARDQNPTVRSQGERKKERGFTLVHLKSEAETLAKTRGKRSRHPNRAASSSASGT